MLKRKLFSRTPANVHAVGLAFTIVVLVAGALSAGLFTKLSGARVDIPAGLYGFSLSRYRDPPSYFRGGEHGTYAAVYYDEDRYHINRAGKCQGRSENVPSWRSNCGLPNTCPVSETTVAVQCS